MGVGHSGSITSCALLIGSTIQNGTSLKMQSIGSWWYKDPMLWIVVLLIIGIIVLKARQNK
jgi:membrane protein DedA with SNARE-associated domain